jgi:hypothetical protein
MKWWRGQKLPGRGGRAPDFSPRRCDRLFDAADLCLSEDQFASGALQLRLVWPRVDDEQQIVLLYWLIVDDIE